MPDSALPENDLAPLSDVAPQWSIVVPMRDEAGNVAPLMAEIAAAVAPLGAFEIVTVNDGSRDSTAAELAKAAEIDANIRIVTHAASAGQSQALISGALAARATVLITIDGDGQNDPADIARLIEARRGLGPSGHQALVIGRRTSRSDGAAKLIASRVAALARRILLADTALDSGCGLKIMDRDVFLSLPRFDSLHRFVPALVARSGGQVVSVPVSHRPRRNGRSKYGVSLRGMVGLIDLLGVAWLIARHTRPRVSR